MSTLTETDQPPMPLAGRVLAGLVLVVAAVIGGWAARTLLHPSQLSATVQSPETPATALLSRSGRELSSAAVAKAGLIPRYHAIVIGINEYENTGWQPLRTARRDAIGVADVLEKQYGFTVQRLLDKQATRAHIISNLDNIASLTDSDAVLIYYAGHGYYTDNTDEGYWIPHGARKTVDNRLAKEDWIWNSTITKIIDATPARHLLIIADSCYSGSLFRGELNRPKKPLLSWYKRALSRPSRYLITSGNLEPVLDNGVNHSPFTQQLLHYLRYTDKDVFSASDLAVGIRDEVSTLTQQLVRNGRLPVAGHAGGEFVFVKPGSPLDAESPRIPLETEQHRSASTTAPPGPSDQQRLENAVWVHEQGAPKSAARLMVPILEDHSEEAAARAVQSYIGAAGMDEELSDLRSLVAYLHQRDAQTSPTANPYADYATPRIIACLGPSAAVPDPQSKATALLYRVCLQDALQRYTGVKLVVRQTLNAFMRERELGEASITDQRTRTVIKDFLPAGLLLIGTLFPAGEGNILILRLADSGTSQLLGSFTASTTIDQDIYALCEDLAAQVVERAMGNRPLTARILGEKQGTLRAGIGKFHGASADTLFTIFERVPIEDGEFDEQELGQATIRRLKEDICELTPQWAKHRPTASFDTLWVRERSPF